MKAVTRNVLYYGWLAFCSGGMAYSATGRWIAWLLTALGVSLWYGMFVALLFRRSSAVPKRQLLVSKIELLFPFMICAAFLVVAIYTRDDRVMRILPWGFLIATSIFVADWNKARGWFRRRVTSEQYE